MNPLSKEENFHQVRVLKRKVLLSDLNDKKLEKLFSYIKNIFIYQLIYILISVF